jgi:hypothetical protein
VEDLMAHGWVCRTANFQKTSVAIVMQAKRDLNRSRSDDNNSNT